MLKYYIATGETETDILAEYGVHVSGSTGLLGRPDFKTPKKYSWDYLHGEWVDLRSLRYKPREIKLKCWVKANSEQAAINRMNTFMKAFDQEQLVRLHIVFVNNGNGSIPVGGNNGLFYLVYLSKAGQPSYKWNPSRQFITFEITLTEPSPVKRVLKVESTEGYHDVTFNFTSSTEFDIHWGDGSMDYDNVGTDTVKHLYESGGRHYIIFTGVIRNITDLTIETSSGETTVTTIYSEI